MDEEQPQVQMSVAQFLMNCKTKMDSLILPTIDDKDIDGSPVILESEKSKIRKELESEVHTWGVKIPKEGITDENFSEIKGKIMKKIVDKMMKLSNEEPEPKKLGGPPMVKA